MRRRILLAAMLCVLLATQMHAVAQQAGRAYRIGFLWDGPDVFPDAIEAFRQGLRDLGYVEGENLVIEFRWADGKPDRMRELAAELVSLRVDVIMAPSSIYTRAALEATSTIPVVFLSHADPLGSGHVASLAHPGGNVTGLSIMMTETNVKGLELFREAVPGLSRVAVIYDPATPSHGPGMKAIEAAGPSLGLDILPVPAATTDAFDAAFAGLARDGADGILVLSTPLYIAGAKRLAELALEYRLPTLFGPKHHVLAGGLMSYSPDRPDLYRRGATFVDRILRGADAGSLPVEQPTRFELVINVATARALGLEIPPGMLLRADEVIE